MKTLVMYALGATLLAGASLAAAHEGHEVKKTVIIKHVKGERGTHHEHAVIAKCQGATPEVDVSDESKQGDKVKRSRVIICNKGGSGVDIVATLEKAREGIATQQELSAEARSKALAAIDAAIERHRTK